MAPLWGRFLGCALIVISAIGYVLAFVHYGGSPLIWFANLLVLLGVAAATYQLLPLVGLLPIWGRQLLMLVIRLLEFILRILIGITFVLAVLILEIISIIAMPLEMLVGRNKQPERAWIVDTKEYTKSSEPK
jgi:hypothetical protein